MSQDDRKEELAAQLDKLTAKVKALESRNLSLQEANKRLADLLDKRKAAAEVKSESIDKLKLANAKLQTHARYFSENQPVNRYLRFARSCLDVSSAAKADAYIARGVQALPAAYATSRKEGGRLFCDVIEIPSVSKRGIESMWHSTNSDLLDMAFLSYLGECDRLLSVSWSARNCDKRFTDKVTCIPNYRPAGRLARSTRIRKDCGLGDNDVLVLSVSTVYRGFEPVLRSLESLPKRVHLAILGEFASPALQDSLLKTAKNIRCMNRFHILEPVPYPKLLAYMSAADLGVIPLDPDIPNHYYSLPNRIFDYMFAGVPVVSPDIPDITAILGRTGMGITLDDTSPSAWASGIKVGLNTRQKMRKACLSARKDHSWNLVEDDLVDAVANPNSVTIFGFSDLSKTNRVNRMAETLIRSGSAVTYCSQGDETSGQRAPAGVRILNLPKC